MVNFEKFLNFSTHHSESIIQWVFFIILGLCGFLIARGLFAKRSEHAAAGAGPETQELLKKIMEQTAKLEGMSAKDMKPGDVAQFEVQLGTLRKDLQTRDEEITRLKGSGGAGGGADSGQLSGRIKELEEKLAEYEILEDDIADLTLYKDENTRLRAELDKVKGVTTPSSAGLAGRAGMTIPDTGDPMADFESTVQLEKQLQSKEEDAAATDSAEPAPAAPSEVPAEAMSAAAEPAPASPSAEGSDDIFSEFTQEKVEPPDPEAPASQPIQPIPTASNEGAVDTNKMLEEMAALAAIPPAQGNALDESIDLEKMAAEAKGPEQA